MSRVLLYVMFILLVATIGFVFCVPPDLQPQNRDARRLDVFMSALHNNPRSIGMVHLVNGRANISFRMASDEKREQSTVIPIEWKGQLVQQLLEKKVPFTVAEPDYSWAIVTALAALSVAYFRFVMLPKWALRTCPNCAERVNSAARLCRYCRSELRPLSLEFGDEAEPELAGDEDAVADGAEDEPDTEDEYERATPEAAA